MATDFWIDRDGRTIFERGFIVEMAVWIWANGENSILACE